MTSNHDSTVPRAQLNFDGDYGVNYKAIIRGSVPGYDTMLGIAKQRLRDRGASNDVIEKMMQARNTLSLIHI